MSEHLPADPAGTQPKVDPDSLVPAAPPDAPRLLPAAVEDEPQPGELERAAPAVPRDTRHTPRFQFLLGALLALGVMAVLAAVALVVGGTRTTGEQLGVSSAWSSWRPTGEQPLQEIADHVTREYRLPNRHQLVDATPSALTFGGSPAQLKLRDAQRGDLSLLGGQTLVYRLCGVGENCSIGEGKPTTQRMFLLRREGLELALYTFRYTSGVDQIVVFLPPPPAQRVGLTLLFRRQDLADELSRPLGSTLSPRTPSVDDAPVAPDAPNVSRLAVLYQPRLSYGNADTNLYLVLQPVPQPR